MKGISRVRNKIARFILATLVNPRPPVFSFGRREVYLMRRGRAQVQFPKSRFNHELKRLQKRKYIALQKDGDGFILRLTKLGRQRLRRIKIEELRLQRKGRWDGRWRLFIFDIPETERTARDLIRMKLKSLGLYNIQRSTFVYPYDCRRELDLVAGHYKVSRYCTFAEVHYIDIDRELRRHFKKLLKI